MGATSGKVGKADSCCLPTISQRHRFNSVLSEAPDTNEDDNLWRATTFTWPFQNWRSAKEEIRSFQPHVGFLHVIASPATTLDKYISTVAQEVVRTVDAERCSLYFVNEVREEVCCVSVNDTEPFSLPWNTGVIGQCVTEKKVLNIVDAHNHATFDDTIENLTGYVVGSMLCLPIMHMREESVCIGAIQAMNKLGENKPSFTEHDALELKKITLLIGDSFYRQRWNALEDEASCGDLAALSLINYKSGYHARERDSNRRGGTRATTRSMKSVLKAETLCAVSDADNLDQTIEQRIAELEDFMCKSPRSMNSCDQLPPSFATGSFDALAYQEQELVPFVVFAMELSGCVEANGVPRAKLQPWAEACRRSYRPTNPFHNFHHGFSVFQFCHFQAVTKVRQFFTDLDLFGLLIAGLCHDLDHPAFTNSFMIASDHHLALTYNDRSVLENHHASLACHLLRGESTNIGSGLVAAEQRSLRHIVIEAILATDMAGHSELCRHVLTMDDLHDFDPSNHSDRKSLVTMLIHTSDLSAQCLPWSCASRWEGLIAKEFSEQAEQERAAGLTPAPFMQFELDDIKHRSKLQCDFIDFVLIPLWGPYTHLIPDMRSSYEILLTNRSLYERRRTTGTDPEVEGASVKRLLSPGKVAGLSHHSPRSLKLPLPSSSRTTSATRHRRSP